MGVAASWWPGRIRLRRLDAGDGGGSDDALAADAATLATGSATLAAEWPAMCRSSSACQSEIHDTPQLVSAMKCSMQMA